MDKGRLTKILVVEDESIVAKNIESRLKRLGYAVPAIVSTGEEAIKKSERTLSGFGAYGYCVKGWDGWC